MPGNRRGRKLIRLILLLVLFGVLACGWYLGDYYRADEEAVAAFAPEGQVDQVELAEGGTAYLPEEPVAGLIFYPGGKVEHTAYQPLMEACAARNILCVLVEMPFRLAVLDMDRAQGIQSQYPQVESWYMAGHSLGGAMAASYLEGTEEEFAGLVLLGAYSAADLSDRNLQVLSLYGDCDQVLDREKYESCRANLPRDFQEVVLEGGCHSGFGFYGPQEGDGVPTLSAEEQILQTARAIEELVN